MFRVEEFDLREPVTYCMFVTYFLLNVRNGMTLETSYYSVIKTYTCHYSH